MQSNVDVKPELQESWNFHEVSEESPRGFNEDQTQQISFIRRKAKALQMDMDDLIHGIVELSYLQWRNQITALIAKENVEEGLCSFWRGPLDLMDKAIYSAYENVCKESKVEN